MEGDRLVGGDNHVDPHVTRTNWDIARGEHLLSERQPDLKNKKRWQRSVGSTRGRLDVLTKEGLRRSASRGERRVGREETIVVALSVPESPEGAIECNAYTKTAKKKQKTQ